MKLLAASTLTSKEQLTLPKAIRQLLGVQAGDRLVWGLDDQGRITVEAGRPHTLADVRAAVAAARPRLPPTRPATLAEIRAGVAKAIRAKHARR